jgi:ABC-type transport system substrate-binding protein
MEIFKLIRDDAPWVFLYRPTYFWAIVNSLEKWSPFFNGVLRLAE